MTSSRRRGQLVKVKYAACPNVFGFDGLQGLAAGDAIAGAQAHGLAQPRAVERIADRARIGEVRLLPAPRDVLDHALRARPGSSGTRSAPPAPRRWQELAGIVVREIDVVRDARAEAGVGGKKVSMRSW